MSMRTICKDASEKTIIRTTCGLSCNRGVPSGNTCTPLQCTEIACLGASKSFLTDETVFWQGDPADHYFLIQSGIMRCVRFLNDGRRQITRFVFPGTLIVHKGEEKHTYGGEGVTPLCVQSIPRRSLDQLTGSHACLSDLVTNSIMQELNEAQDQLLVLGKLLADERVEQFLSELQKKLPQHEGCEINIPMCRTDIADYLGLTVETVSRVFNRLKRRGKIFMISSNRVTLKGPGPLELSKESVAA